MRNAVCLLPWVGMRWTQWLHHFRLPECNIPFLSDKRFKCPFQVVCPNSIGTPPKWIFVNKQETLLCLCGRCESTEIYLKVRTLKLRGNVNSTGILMCYCTRFGCFEWWHQEVLLSFGRMSASLYFLLALRRYIWMLTSRLWESRARRQFHVEERLRRTVLCLVVWDLDLTMVL